MLNLSVLLACMHSGVKLTIINDAVLGFATETVLRARSSYESSLISTSVLLRVAALESHNPALG